ncbi:MAG: peptidylprolyl isomerase [Acidobacteriia bacterium]|nr:peptidylprolyl isomerase [Terriglobia bacterium]
MKPLFLLACVAAVAVAETPGAPGAGSALATAEPGLYAVINTSMGQITAQLFEQDAPLTVSNFVALATGLQPWKDPKTGAMVNRPLYTNLAFNRVIPEYVIQTGDPTNTGTYDCGVRVKDELDSGLRFDRPGRLGLMNSGESDTGGCQFFITDDAYSSLDPSRTRNGYTVFGQVVEGQDVVNKISNVPCDARGRPRTPVRMVSVSIRRVGEGPAPPKPEPVSESRQPSAPTKLPKLD